MLDAGFWVEMLNAGFWVEMLDAGFLILDSWQRVEKLNLRFTFY